MAGLFDKQAAIYRDARPTYPSEWFSMLADLTPRRSLAWDAGTGNGQAALALAGHYEKVIATDISEEQLKYATEHPRVKFLHTPPSLSEDELVSMIGGENSVDLVTVATAVHYFDLQKFYSIVTRVLRKPGGIIAVWTYSQPSVSPTLDPILTRFYESTAPFWNPKAQLAFDGYKTLPFPFESVGLDCHEGKPLVLDMPMEISFDRLLNILRSSSGFNMAKEKGVDLLPESYVKELENAWGGADLIRSVNSKTAMLVGKVKL